MKTKLDETLAGFGVEADHSIEVEVGNRERTNIAIRIGERDLLVSLIDCGDHLSIDLESYSDAGEETVEVWAMEAGAASAKASGRVAIVQVAYEAAA